MDFKSYVSKLKLRLEVMDSLFGSKELICSYDILSSKVKKTKRELLYFHINGNEESGVFIFGFDFFIKELSEQDFKKHLSSNPLTYNIYRAYHILKKKQRKIKITDIVNLIQNEKKDSQKVDEIISRILSLAYYFNWDIQKDPKDFEGDSFIKMPENYLLQIKKRFNYDVMANVYENSEIFVFVNSRAKINVVFKEQDEFTKKDVEKIVIPTIKKIFGIKSVKLK